MNAIAEPLLNLLNNLDLDGKGMAEFSEIAEMSAELNVASGSALLRGSNKKRAPVARFKSEECFAEVGSNLVFDSVSVSLSKL